MIDIRQEQTEDFLTVQKLITQAFGAKYAGEAEIVGRLRNAEKITLALVAESEGKIVGHIAFSPLIMESAPEGFRGIGLGPLAVLPEYQGQGIGSRLIREGLRQCREAGDDVVVLFGHPGYYPRFGFSKAGEHGLENRFGVDEPFMALELKEGALEQVSGMVDFQPEFAG